jgi:hypothetical protein
MTFTNIFILVAIYFVANPNGEGDYRNSGTGVIDDEGFSTHEARVIN